MKNLMSHSDYEDSIDLPSVSDIEFRIKSRKHRQFLKQPLEIWMFVPCNEAGNVILETEFLDMYKKLFKPDFIEKYQQAKERCLFEGVEYTKTRDENEYSYINISKLGKINYPAFWSGYIIEDLIQYKLILTPTAIKQLEL